MIKYLLGCLLLLTNVNAYSAPSGFEIMQNVDRQSKNYKTQSSEVYMEIYDNKNSLRKRYFTHEKKRYIDKTKSLIKFYKPAKVKGTSLLTHSLESSTDNDQWIFLPALRAVKQLSSKDKHDSFMGSDFSYSDVAGRNLNQDSHQFLKETDKYYFVRSTPKDTEDDPYSYIDFIIKKDINTPLKLIFFNKKGQKLKTLTNKKIEKFNNLYLVTEAIMENHLNGSKTSLTISEVVMDSDISDNALGINALK